MRIPLSEKSEALRAHTDRTSVGFQKTLPYACALLSTHLRRLGKSPQLSKPSFRQPDRCCSVLFATRLQTSAFDCVSWTKRYNAKTPYLLKLYREVTAVYSETGGWDSSVGIATRYGVDGPGIESRWEGEIFRTRPDRPWGPPSLLYNGYRIFSEGKAAGAWCWPPIFSGGGLKKGRAIPPPPLRALVAYKGGTFTFHSATHTKQTYFLAKCSVT